MKKNISILKDCYGCGVCSIECPKNIIDIRLNKDGFYEPYITDEEKCIDCGLCLKVCAYHNENVEVSSNPVTPQGYATWSKDKINRLSSSSGGTIYEIAKYMMQKGYKIICVKYNMELKRAEHYLVSDINDLELSKGSKYIPSFTPTGFSQINKTDKFLIVGSPCQIDSLRRYVKINRIESNFIFIDFFCHGVPSMLMWNKYLNSVDKKFSNYTKVSWRNKDNGWHDSWQMKFSDGKQEYSSWRSKGDLFYRFFLGNSCLGSACYDKCKYKMLSSSADIRVGDLWGNKYKSNYEGISSVIAVSEVGKALMNEVKTVEKVEEEIEVAAEGQMQKRVKRPVDYKIVNMLLHASVPLKLISAITMVINSLNYKLSRVIKWRRND